MRLKTAIKLLPALLLILLFAATAAHAAGYALYEWGARANAMGGAFAAKADDPSAVAYNPAGITQLPGTQFLFGETAIAPNSSVKPTSAGGDSGTGKANIWHIPHGYMTHQLNDRVWLGGGFYSRVGLGTEYDEPHSFFGRYNCSYAGIKSTSVAGVLAYKITDEFSVAVAPEAILMDFEYHKFTDAGLRGDPTTTANDVEQKMHARGWAPGYSLGARWQPEPWLAFGLTYKGETRLTVNGRARFTRGPTASSTLAALKLFPPAAATATLLDEGLRDTDVKGTEPIPGSLTAGVMVKPMDNLSLEFDLTRTYWSAYRSLTFEYDNVLGDRKSDKKWHDTWRWQVGAEYQATDWLAVRAGYVYDDSPVPDDHVDYAVPGNDRQIVTMGAGLAMGDWNVDASYGYLWVTDRNVRARPSEGVFQSSFEDGHSHMLGLSVGYKF